MYHPLYEGFRPWGVGISDEPVDLTQGSHIFYPHANEEWFAPLSDDDDKNETTDKSAVNLLGVCTTDDPFDLNNMRPYLSPLSLLMEE